MAQNSSLCLDKLLNEKMIFCPRIIFVVSQTSILVVFQFVQNPNKNKIKMTGHWTGSRLVGNSRRKSEFSTQVFGGLHRIYHDDELKHSVIKYLPQKVDFLSKNCQVPL